MTLGLVIAVALVSGLVSVLLAPRLPRPALWLGLAGAAACLVLAAALGDRDVLTIGSVGLSSSGEVRLVALGWSGTSLLLGLVGAVAGGAAFTLGPGLVALGAALLALAVATAEPGLAFAALAIGGLVAIIAPALGGWLADREASPPVTIALRGAVATAGAGIVGLVLVAWGRSSIGPFAIPAGGDQGADAGLAVGLLILTTVGVTVVRSGAIPAHLWAARFSGTVSPLAVPAALAWGSAAFTLVALGWAQAAASASGFAMDDAGRLLVVLVAVASIALGGLAAILHDDVEHVLGYSIVQDAGVALLAFATLRPEVGDAARDWLVASAALKSALAGWIAVARWVFAAHRVSDLRGWARRSPGLAVTALVILVGSVGLPGTALFDARVALATGVLPGLPGYVIVAAALSPLVALGRVFVAGADRPSPEVAGAPRTRTGVLMLPSGGWSRGGLSRGGVAWALRSGRAVARENAALAAVVATMLLAVLGLALSIAGTGTAAS